MLRAEMLPELREVLGDTVAPYAWSNETLNGYLSEGQDVFCEKTGYFRDKSNYSVVTVAGQKSYPIPSRVIKVLEVWDGARKLSRFTENDRPSGSDTIPENTRPKHWQTDGETGMLTFFEPPEAGITLTLRVWRYARTSMAANPSVEPEIPERFHRACVEYAAFKAYSHHDREESEKVKASDHLTLFRGYCADGVNSLWRLTGEEVRVGPNPIYTFS